MGSGSPLGLEDKAPFNPLGTVVTPVIDVMMRHGCDLTKITNPEKWVVGLPLV